MVRGEAENIPEKRWASINVCVSFTTADASAKKEYSKRPMIGHCLPDNSDIGAQSVGSDAKPRT